MAGWNVHGERVIDGVSSTLTALSLFESGSVTARTLGSTEFLHIVDVLIITEDASDVELVVDTAAAGKYIVNTKTAAGVPINIHFHQPYVCPKGVVPKFKGGGANRNMCVIQGFISEA
ncbi:hypothetical protein LCGC14_1179860 [marine sediment metagenome]|uniref:Uncharacterized protein n=1 Tax=marine sediment metagenome TaxID=412755 RepID=A0A0F9LMP1_9ZZZZ